MPQNLEAEMMALGCAFLTRYACDKVCEDLNSIILEKESYDYILRTFKNEN